MKRACPFLLATFLAGRLAAAEGEAGRRSPVGMPARIEQIVLAGTELEARPIEDRQSPLVVRVVASYRHGDAFRYDLEYYGLEPGQFDLRDHLRRKDGSAVDNLPPLPVEIESLLPAGQILPSDLKSQPAPRVGGYTLIVSVGMLLWLAGLIALVFVGRRKAVAAGELAEARTSLAQRLRPLVESGLAGNLSTAQQAELERLLLAYWSRRLGLNDADPPDAMAQLRQHPEAGALLRQMEAWLHQPGGGERADVGKMLAPYLNLPADEVELSSSGGKSA